MITGLIKNKVDKIWDDIFAGGISNPQTVIEQLTYLMFIRSLDEKELEQEEFDNMTGKKVTGSFLRQKQVSPCAGVGLKIRIRARYLPSSLKGSFRRLKG